MRRGRHTGHEGAKHTAPNQLSGTAGESGGDREHACGGGAREQSTAGAPSAASATDGGPKETATGSSGTSGAGQDSESTSGGVAAAAISEAEAERRAIDFFDGLHADLPPEAEFANLIRSIVAQLRRRRDLQADRRQRHGD